jgi:hypothetical protein
MIRSMTSRTTFLAAMAIGMLSQIVCAQACERPAVLKITGAGKKLVYELNGKTSSLYPLSAVAEATGSCTPPKTLFVVAGWDVPLTALTTPGKLQLEHVRYFVEGRDGRTYIEFVHGPMFAELPLSPNIRPLPEDDNTLHPPNVIPHTKGQQ